MIGTFFDILSLMWKRGLKYNLQESFCCTADQRSPQSSRSEYIYRGELQTQSETIRRNRCCLQNGRMQLFALEKQNIKTVSQAEKIPRIENVPALLSQITNGRVYFQDNFCNAIR